MCYAENELSLINDSSKFFLYSKLISDIILEEYLKSERNFKNRQLLTTLEILAILNGLLKASTSLLSISNSANISFAKVYFKKISIKERQFSY
jgi:hypothetical protein